jgi:hypothetical protein
MRLGRRPRRISDLALTQTAALSVRHAAALGVSRSIVHRARQARSDAKQPAYAAYPSDERKSSTVNRLAISPHDGCQRRVKL